MNPKKIILVYINIANAITLLGLLFSLAGCFFALNGNIRLGIIFLIISGICDLFDGAVARKIERTDLEKAYGGQLDSIVDAVSFGIAPAAIVLSSAGAEWYALLVYAFYIACVVSRLAYFSAAAVPNVPPEHYQGLPTTYIALILPIVMLFRSSFASIIALAAVGLLFVLNIKVPKPRGIWYILFPLIAIALIALWWLW
ncbi:MAG: CDP-alcohol phosphatidyltransferase family protein [Defluviitaleaceae bacterium]|nr:CDP-alcohol phosphatidyltransferase family protein [Defluviitaleaceae bacterium]